MIRKSILISEFSHKKLKNISKSHSRNIQLFVEQMIDYFSKTGQDPVNYLKDSPSAMIKTLDKRVVSFFKVQERDILKPLQDEVYKNKEFNKELFIKLANSIDNAFLQFEKRQDEKFQKQELGLKLISEYFNKKEISGLQQQFNKLFS